MTISSNEPVGSMLRKAEALMQAPTDIVKFYLYWQDKEVLITIGIGEGAQQLHRAMNMMESKGWIGHRVDPRIDSGAPPGFLRPPREPASPGFHVGAEAEHGRQGNLGRVCPGCSTPMHADWQPPRCADCMINLAQSKRKPPEPPEPERVVWNG